MKNASAFPSLPALRAFAATAQRLSFRGAAEALYMTQSAVSHHIAALEALLGTPLFVRRHRSVELTAAGQQYLAEITPALAQIAVATKNLRAKSGLTKPLRVALLPSFAANWLVPRLAGLQAHHPDILLELLPSLALVNLADGDTDVAIRYGDGLWRGVQCTHLMDEILTPVASPGFLGKHPIKKLADILPLPKLLNLRPLDWQLWLSATKLKGTINAGLQLTDYNIALQAALGGQGILMGRVRLIESKVATGELVELFPNHRVQSRRAAYWLLQQARAKGTPRPHNELVFADWLIRACGGNEQTEP